MSYRSFLFRITIPFIFLCYNSEGSSPSQIADSLAQVVAHQPENAAKVDNLVQLARNYFLSGQPDSAMARSEQAFDLASGLKYNRGIGDASFLLSSLFRSKSQLIEALYYSDKYLDIYTELNDSLRLSKGYYNLGLIHKELTNYDLAMFYCQKSIANGTNCSDLTPVLGSYNCIGSIFMSGKAKYDSAAYYYLKAYAIAEKVADLRNLATIINNLGSVYFEDKQYDMARNYFNKSLDLCMTNRYDNLVATCYNGLGRIAGIDGDYVKALNYYNSGLELFNQFNNKRGVADIKNNSGDVYFKQKNYPEALEKFSEALEIYKKIPYPEGMMNSMINISAVYSEMGNVTKAMAIQDSCVALAYKTGGKRLVLLALENIVDNYKKEGDYRKAFDSLVSFVRLKDNLFSIEQSQAIHATMLKYEKEKDQARILKLEKENLQKTNQRNAYMFTGIGILIITLSIIAYFRQKARHDRILAEQKIRRLEEEKKLMAAKLLVEGQEEERKRIATELHDGLGVLLSATKMQFSTIIDKSPENKELIEKASRMLEQASGDVRKISHNMMPGLLTKLGLYEAVEDLLEQIDENTSVNATCIITGDQDSRLPENKEIMLYRIVQELTNNTLKHAGAENIELYISIMPGKLDIVYTDDGKGFDYKGKLQSESFGLHSMQSRVNFLNGEMNIDSSPGLGVKYTFSIPV